MRGYHVLTAAMALGTVVFVGSALADGPSGDYAGVKVGQVRFIDHAFNLIQLADGTELRATDPQLLRGLSEGEWVKVDFTTDGDRVMINSVERAEPDAASGPTPTAVGGPTEFGTNIRAH